MKKNIKVILDSNVLYEIGDKTFEEVVDYINCTKKKYPTNYNFRFELDSGWDCTELTLFADRIETDKEHDTRLKREKDSRLYRVRKQKEDKLKKENEERKLLATLQKKYNNA